MRFFREPFWNLNAYTVIGAILLGIIVGLIIGVYTYHPPSQYGALCSSFSAEHEFTQEDYITINTIAFRTEQLLNVSEEEALLFLNEQPCVSNILKLPDGSYVLNFTNDKKLLVTDAEHLENFLQTGKLS